MPENSNPAYRIVGSAGHIDHGKSTLVQALTGIDPDRLREEKERGITIDLGFADMALGDLQVGFIDVPGHERLVKNMLAGIGGIDAVLLVVAADESIMPQTREHFAICQMLGISAGVVAITKADLADAEMIELVELEIEEMLAGSSLEGCEIVTTSVSESASRLDDLRAALGRCLARTPPRPADGLLRMPIDRVFSVRGFGTVATGTLLGGRIAAGDSLEIQPGSRRVQVRGLQVHGGDQPAARAGQRAALNLQGAQVGQLQRGQIVARPGTLAVSHMLDVRIDTLAGAELRHLQRVRFHHGAAETLGRLSLLDTVRLPAASSGYAQLRLESPYAAVPGDRFVLRRYSPVTTIAGGVVVDAHPVGRRRAAASSADLRALENADDAGRLAVWARAAEDRGVPIDDLAVRLGRDASTFTESVDEACAAGSVLRVAGPPARLVAAEPFRRLTDLIAERLADYHRRFPMRPAMPKQELRSAVAGRLPEAVFDAAVAMLVEQDRARAAADGFAAATHSVQLREGDNELRDRILALFTAAGLAVPSPPELLAKAGGDGEASRELFHHLLREGTLLRVRDDMVVDATAIDALIEDLRRRVQPGGRFSVADFKAWTGLTRKHSIPVLEHLDARRITRRGGDERILI